MQEQDLVLQIEQLQTSFLHEGRYIPAVDGVSFQIRKGETVAIVGESGSGKSVTALSVMGLIPSPPGKITGGSIQFQGQDMVNIPEKQMRHIRGNRISMIFQEPMTSLNPVQRIGDQIAEVIRLHQKVGKKEAMDKTIDILRLVGIPAPEKRVYDYPHQLSGGMRQRVMIGMALSCNPALLVADEPTTALDVTIQAQILDLIKSLQQQLNMAVLIITHDLGVVAEVADRVVVMYGGRIMEQGTAEELFSKPLHPYTEGLLKSIPRMDTGKGKLYAIPGSVPSLADLPKGCVFQSRCDRCMDICIDQRPELTVMEDGRKVSCWLYSEGGMQE